ncbi:amino acid permease [Bacillus sp. SA1-12]|uniref:amino acid permease n=1 Tax=Bacillus sp. SA1-12 TaxID=1455638 RepID=UPI00062726D4|nr:amino acid permease [Bacillus sp. SA1-12]KKI90148.1 amino acid permease [Bacillus sp. SA1-12]
MSNKQESLKRTMTSRHIMMMALGGAIGAGLFKGSSTAIDMAGPAVILAYMVGGIILLFIMQGLAEMAVRNKQARTFRDLIEPVLGKYAAHFLDWIYWKMWVLNIAAESVVAAIFLQYWLPDIPVWILALMVSAIVTLVNLFSVKLFAETEYWLTLLKISVIVLFIITGLTILLIPFQDHTATGFTHLTQHGGFFPNGMHGLIMAMLVVIYSYGGTEMIGVTLAEVKDPEKIIPKAVRGTLIRIISFYILPFFIIVSLIPWNQVNGVPESPFVTVFNMIRIPYADHIMNAIILLAIISSMNSGLYASSRVLYTQAADGRMPKLFAKVSKRQVPVYAILACTSSLYAGVLISVFAGSNTFNYLMGSLGYTVLCIWIIIAIAHLKSRKNQLQKGNYKVRFYPYTTWFALLALIAILIGVIATTSIIVTTITIVIYLFITIAYFRVNSRIERRQAA